MFTNPNYAVMSGATAASTRASALDPELLESVREAFHAGLQEPTMYDLWDGNPDLKEFIESTHPANVIPGEQSTTLHKVKKLCDQAVQAAGKEKFDVASRFLRVAKHLLTSTDLSREAQLWGTDVLRAAEAYLYYRDARPEEAREATEEALSAKTQLRDEFGWDDTEFRRLHLGRNVVRIEARYGDERQAAKQGFDLLRCIGGQPDAWPFQSDCRIGVDEELNTVASDIIFMQISRELGLLFVYGDSDRHAEMLAEGHRFLDESTSAKPRIRALRGWIEGKTLLHDGEPNAFLAHAGDVLREGKLIHPLWYAVVLDVYDLCEGHELSEAQAFRGDVIEHMGSYEKLRDLKSPQQT